MNFRKLARLRATFELCDGIVGKIDAPHDVDRFQPTVPAPAPGRDRCDADLRQPGIQGDEPAAPVT